MKKRMFLWFFMGIGLTSWAQEEVVTEVAEIPTAKYSVETNSFWDNWFVSLNGGIQASYLDPDNKAKFGDKLSFLGLAYVGKWFTPGAGLRLAYNGYSFKGYSDKMDYMNLHVDVLMDVTNMIMGYDPYRTYHLIPYVGFGGCRNFNRNLYAFGMNAGLLNSFRLSDAWALNLELSLLMADKELDNKVGSKRGFDKLVGLTAGITYNIGNSTWQSTPDVDALMVMNAAQVAQLNTIIAQQQENNNQLKSQLAQKPKEVVREKLVTVPTAPQSVFFAINSAQIASQKELVNLQAIADLSKKDNVKIQVTGYADSATGNAAYNQQLSLKRAQTVADELVKLGANKSNLMVEGKGGVATLTPSSYNRRVILEIK